MRTIVVLLSAAVLVGSACAGTHHVSIYGGAQYTEVQPAVNNASAGDTIMVYSGAYQGFTVDRPLIIIGVGTGTGSNEASLIEGIVTLTGDADSTELQGLWIRTSVSNHSVDSLAGVLRIRSGATGVLVWRCYMENTYVGTFNFSSLWIGSECTVKFLQCVNQCDAASGGRGIWATGSGSIITLEACVVTGRNYPLYFTGSTTIQASQCVFTSGSTAYLVHASNSTGELRNCAFVYLGGTPIWSSIGSLFFAYCGANNLTPPGSNNLLCSTGDFVLLASGNDPRSNDYHLAESSVLRDAGDPALFDLDSTRSDVGVYGGMHPFVENGAPPYPFVLSVDVPTAVPQNGALRVHARGRIGPGH